MPGDFKGPDRTPGFWTSRHAIGLIVIGAVAAYFLLTEHLAHVVGALPYLLLLACPLILLFMSGGQGGHGGHHHDEDGGTTPSTGAGSASKQGDPS